MKRLNFETITLIAVFLMFLFGMTTCPAVHAQTWYPLDQATVSWDPVTKLIDGSQLPAGSTVQYLVFTKVGVSGTPQQVGQAITATQLTITFSAEGSYFVGVKAQRIVGGSVVSESATVSWSNDPAVVLNAQTWGIVHYIGIDVVKGLQKP